jgi:PRC-barrel domain
MMQTASIRLAAAVCLLGAGGVAVKANDTIQTLVVAASTQAGSDEKAKGGDQNKDGEKGKDQNSGGDKKKEMTPEEKMQARFPQPVKVGHLVGLPVLDGNDSTIGYVRQVVRTPEGKIQFIVPYSKWFGWARDGGLLAWGRRLVAVPIEVVAILALQINAIDMDRGAFDQAPTWVAGQSEPIPPDQTIKIALGRR